jgi:hypothetical protein
MTRLLWLCGLGIVLLSGAASADDKKGADPFEAMRKAAAPGPFHKKLDPMNGSWTWTSKMWFDPSKPPMDGSGIAERKWILDGRFLQDDVVSKELFGDGFKGFGLTGYDNSQKKYIGVWSDTFTTALSSSVGTVDESGKVFTFQRDEVDPASGQKIKGRDVIRIIDNNKHTMEMYKVLPDGKDVKVMEINFTRKAK